MKNGSKSTSSDAKNYKKKKNSRVSFSPNVYMRKMPAAADLVESPRQIWYQEDEYDKIRERSFNLIHFVETRGIHGLNGKVPCIRGLENMLSERQQVIAYLRRLAYESVLDNADAVDGDVDSIATIYHHVALPSTIDALKRARQDAMEM